MATFSVYHGAAKPLKAIGKNQSHALRFAAEYPGWHTFARDRPTLNAIAGLKRRGAICTNEHGQFRIAYGETIGGSNGY